MVHRCEYGDERGDRREREPRPVGGEVGQVDGDEHRRERADRERSGGAERVPTRRAGVAHRSPRLPQERGGSSEEQAARPGDGRQVENVYPVGSVDHGDRRRHDRVAVRPDPRRHHDGDADPRDRPADRAAGGEADPGDGDDDERPDDVPLFFDREAPEMAQHRGVARREVRRFTRDLPPVGDVEQRPGQVAANLRRLLGGADREHPDRDGDQDDEERREQPPESPHPERTEGHGPATATFLDQERRDEEARHDEEHLDPEEPTLHPREPAVVEQHGDDRDGAQAVERRLVPETGHHGSVVGHDRKTYSHVGRTPRRFRRDAGQRRTVVPSLVVSTVQPSACNSARSESAVA